VNAKRVVLLVLAAALLLVAGGVASSLAAAPAKVRTTPIVKLARPRAEVRRVNPRLTRRFRAMTWRWQNVLGRRRSRLAAPLSTQLALRFWRGQARRMLRVASRPPHKSAWQCIHRYEGSWWDSGDPYWGGLQMGRGFMGTYAPNVLLRRGWANRWSPLEQMWVAEHAYSRGRGFYPWPNTARACGLL
jgi:hypothetical protein